MDLEIEHINRPRLRRYLMVANDQEEEEGDIVEQDEPSIPPQHNSINSGESSMARAKAKPIVGNPQEQEDSKINKEPYVPEIRWERGEMIGSGSYGKVYQGLNLNNGKLIAIKSVQISSKKAALKELMALKYEVSILRELDHPNIVKYIYTDADPDKKRVDILLEYVPGGSLSSLLKKFGPFNEKVTKIYLHQMLSALIYIHSKHIIHRDLKCANILINNDASIRMSDFGASKKLKLCSEGGYELTNSLKGSPYWLAPEIANREGHDTSCDIWSLGCCTIEMITGRPPWSDRSKKASKVLALIKNPKEKITVPKGLSDECYDFIFKACCNRDPKKRWTAEELVHHPYLKKRLGSDEMNDSDSQQLDLNQIELIENKVFSKTHQIQNDTAITNLRQRSFIDEVDRSNVDEANNDEQLPRSVSMPEKYVKIQEEVKSKQESKNVPSNEEARKSVLPFARISAVKMSDNDEHKSATNNDNSCDISNFSRWSDTQLDDGTCSMNFVKLCKTEEEKKQFLENERIKLQNQLKAEILKSSQQKMQSEPKIEEKGSEEKEASAEASCHSNNNGNLT